MTKRLSIQQCFLYAIASPKDLARRLSTKHCQVTPEELETPHKAKFLPAHRPMIVTGVAITSKGLRVPNRRHRAIADGFRQYRSMPNAIDASKIYTELVSRMHEAGQIESHWKARAQTLQVEHRRRVHAELAGRADGDAADVVSAQAVVARAA